MKGPKLSNQASWKFVFTRTCCHGVRLCWGVL